jgi:hypothetical protein
MPGIASSVTVYVTDTSTVDSEPTVGFDAVTLSAAPQAVTGVGAY